MELLNNLFRHEFENKFWTFSSHQKKHESHDFLPLIFSKKQNWFEAGIMIMVYLTIRVAEKLCNNSKSVKSVKKTLINGIVKLFISNIEFIQ